MDRATERDRIKDIWGGDGAGIMALLERQFGVLHNRAQVLLGLAFYVGAISVMLTNPIEGGLPAR